MRYIYQEPVVTTITDEEIPLENIKEIFTDIMQNQQTVQMSYEDPNHFDHLKSMDSVRIIAVNENTIDIHVFMKQASVKYKDIPFVNVKKIRLLASKEQLSKKYNNKVSKWHYMEVAEFEG